MKRNLLLSFAAVIIMIIVMRWQGSSLITPLSPKGIIDFEFARTASRLAQLRLFWDSSKVMMNIYLDFLFILAYTWFLVTACHYIRSKGLWAKWSNIAATIAISAGLFDACENFLMILVWNGKFNTTTLEIIFYCALIKFILAGLVILYLLLAWPFSLIKRKATPR